MTSISTDRGPCTEARGSSAWGWWNSVHYFFSWWRPFPCSSLLVELPFHWKRSLPSIHVSFILFSSLLLWRSSPPPPTPLPGSGWVIHSLVVWWCLHVICWTLSTLIPWGPLVFLSRKFRNPNWRWVRMRRHTCGVNTLWFISTVTTKTHEVPLPPLSLSHGKSVSADCDSVVSGVCSVVVISGLRIPPSHTVLFDSLFLFSLFSLHLHFGSTLALKEPGSEILGFSRGFLCTFCTIYLEKALCNAVSTIATALSEGKNEEEYYSVNNWAHLGSMVM